MIKGSDISIAQLRVLLAVAEEQSYTRAAARLGVSQSGVSHSMQALEKLVGGSLIIKSPEGLVPTALGELVLTSAKKVVGELQILSQQVAQFHNEVDETLKIGVIPSALSGWLSPLLASFTSRYPEAISLVLEGMEEEIKEWVESGVINMGVTTDVTQLNLTYWREHFDWQLLKKDEIVAVLPVNHQLSKQDNMTVAELAEHPLIMSSGGCEALIQQIFAHSLEEVDTFQVDLWVRDTQTLLQMVAGDVGVSLVPTLALSNKPTANVVTRPLSPRRDRNLIAFWPKRQPLNPVGKQFLREC
ncbi:MULTISPECIES: LysR family transcriptional regulator [Halomonadaceae]|jgi:DNA-binding transcriptional LysR family regulator|nr:MULTISPECIES: LysR family transcriptional regulator [Halomonas]QKS27127.1 Hca operon transcriptional activator HcaR [Halomonas titanicae]CDG51264.1 Transcriptional regulator [Halomonas sp. A3H3]SDJ14321.1 DNA-binding transcriptional regulator, LysR family [Halomonas titanicae]